MYTPNQIADYIIFRLTSEDEAGVENLKLQKLLYYTQAWHLAFNNTRLIDGEFQAWIHGPVNREIYDRFRDTKYLYSYISVNDVPDISTIEQIKEEHKIHTDNILDAYAPYSATELEVMTHREDPWIIARKGYSPTQRCEKPIDDDIMRDYYKKRLG